MIAPTMNEADNIERFLRSIPAEIAVVIVDSSTDATPELIAAIRPSATVVRANANIPTARQIGSGVAATRWLLFADADVTFAPGYFDELDRLVMPPHVGGVVGTKSSADGFDTYHRWFVRGQRWLTAIGVPAASGSNMLVSAVALERVGGFDPALSVNEDTELMFRVRKAGHAVVFAGELTVQAFDHRRLEAGLVHKVLHGAVRNTALYLGVFPERVRGSDWGYWKRRDSLARTP